MVFDFESFKRKFPIYCLQFYVRLGLESPLNER
jgi:hypothetical protein